ncbi:hypothetical protein PR002_g13735 [Phytophthora rubi]|uniref:Integrase catalytic domain-containing protein n=1 Tax=Phytophthora rubi TaxID=129364 RepID=A0A6A3L9S5_9STRA|nr:hypothetical protein PR002_g13735 [Phytophthora rubi]
MRRELERMEITLAEGEVASIVLSNAVAVYPSIANGHTQRVSRLCGGYDKDQRVQDAVNRLLVAERTARDQISRENRDAGQGVQRQVNLVTRNSSSGREQQQQGGNKRRYNGGGGRGSGKKKKQDDEVARKRRDEIAEKKRNSECNACHQRGHWWKECPERKSTDPREIRTMAGAVLRRVEKEQKDDRPADAQRDRQQDRPRVDFVATHPVTLSVDRQRADVNSYSKIYTRHELAALVGRDFEERLVRARDTQREEQSVEYSPTSPPDADAESLHGATGLLPTRRVLVARSERPDRVPPNEMEWILDSGAQVNVTGDLALLNNVKNLKQVELLEGATGGFGRVEFEGAVLMPVVNEHSGETETRLLENVRYSPGTKINLISQTYMQFKCGYKLIVSDDQLVTWLVKPTMKLKFVMRDGLYRMRVERRNKLVLSAQKPSADSNVMELLHNRLNHVAMDTIKEMVASKVDMGVKVNTRNLSFYECVPCIESKIKRMTYSRNPRRATRPLEKLSADICTINEVSADKSTMFLLVMDEFSRYKWAYLLKSKADASDHLKHLILKLEKKFKPLSVMLFHADGGGEFISNAFTAFCANQGVELNYTHADSPEENGIVKRNNGIIVSRVRSMLDATRLPNSL